MVDTRDIEQDELHKNHITTKIKEYIDSINAVFILANGTIPRIKVGTDYALSTLSSIFSKSLAGNIAFVFTNVPSPLSWHFPRETIPDVLKHAPRFLLDNPIALYKRSLGFKGGAKGNKVMHKMVQEGEQKALEMLVELFDWLDGLEPQPTKEIVYLYYLSQTIEATMTKTLAQMDQVAAKKVEVDKLMVALKDNTYVSLSPYSYLGLNLMPIGYRI